MNFECKIKCDTGYLKISLVTKLPCERIKKNISDKKIVKSKFAIKII